MTYRKINDNKILAIASALRAKNGTNTKYSIMEVPDAIGAIKSETGSYNIGLDSLSSAYITLPSGVSDTLMIHCAFYGVRGDTYYTVGGTESTLTSTTEYYRTWYKTAGVSALSRYACGVTIIDNSNGSYASQSPTLMLRQQRLVYYDTAGTSVVNTEYVTFAEAATYKGTQRKSSTVYYTYTFDGWSESSTGSKISLNKILYDRTLYPHFTATARTYTVTFMNGSTTLYTKSVTYGSSVTYGGVATSTLVDPQGRSGYVFKCWDKETTYITANTVVTAVFWGTYNDESIDDSWATVIANCNNGTYKQKYSAGMYKYLSIDGYNAIVRVVGVDADTIVGGNTTAPLTFMCQLFTRKGKIHKTALCEDGYSACWARSVLNSTVYNTVQSPVKAAIKQVKKRNVVETTNDYIWLPTLKELGQGYSYPSYGSTYNTTAVNAVNNSLEFAVSDYVGFTRKVVWTRDFSFQSDFTSSYLGNCSDGAFAVINSDTSASSDIGWLMCFCI